jgi:hypothetical protein
VKALGDHQYARWIGPQLKSSHPCGIGPVIWWSFGFRHVECGPAISTLVASYKVSTEKLPIRFVGGGWKDDKGSGYIASIPLRDSRA